MSIEIRHRIKIGVKMRKTKVRPVRLYIILKSISPEDKNLWPVCMKERKKRHEVEENFIDIAGSGDDAVLYGLYPVDT